MSDRKERINHFVSMLTDGELCLWWELLNDPLVQEPLEEDAKRESNWPPGEGPLGNRKLNDIFN
jgi:hypothetical protein